MEFEEYKNTIEQNFPGFRIDKIDKAGEGFDSVALEVNGEYIFRFPKSDFVSNNLAKEICLLTKLSPKLQISIPDFKFIGKFKDNNFNFVGYKKIKGDQLSQKLLFSLPEKLREELIKKIADFIKQIHAFTLSEAKQCGVEEESTKNKYSDLLEKAKGQLVGLIDANTKKYLDDIFETFLVDDKNLIYTPTLIHADLSPDHILFDPSKKEITGIIDFGDIRISDPDYDLIYFFEDYSPEFLQSFLKFYPHPDHDRLFTKLKFFRKANWLYDILFGLEHHDQDRFNWALEGLKKYVQS